MNLLDILSESSTQMDSYLDGVEEPKTTQLQPQDNELNNVLYLPTSLTRIQKIVSEIIVQIFAPMLKQELQKKRARASISSLLESPEDNEYSEGAQLNKSDSERRRSQQIALMFEQLRQLSMHPALLIDHFVSKNMLLLETKERLLSMSGKLVLFNQIVDALAAAYDPAVLPGIPSDDYDLLVVSDTITELEWIEGTIIGKNLSYKNLSTRRLFEEQSSPSREALLRQQRDAVAMDEDASSSSNGSLAGESRRKRRHILNRRKTLAEIKPRLTVHLVTTRQLYESFLSSVKFDMVFSFDPSPDLSSASFEMLRSNSKAAARQSLLGHSFKTPVLIPIPIFSMEHLIETIPAPSVNLEGSHGSEGKSGWMLHVIGAFVANRHRLYERKEGDQHELGLFMSVYGKNMRKLQELLFEWHKVVIPSSHSFLQEAVLLLQLSWTEELFQKHLDDDYLAELNPFKMENCISKATEEFLDYNAFKSKLAVALNEATEQIEVNLQQGIKSVLPKQRQEATDEQLKIDEAEDQMAEMYRRLRKLNEDASIVDRKYNRTESGFSRLEKLHQENAHMLEHLHEVIKSSDESGFEKLSGEQDEVLDSLTQEKERLQGELDKSHEEGEALRESYQTRSSEAVKASAELHVLKTTEEKLSRRLNGPGIQALPSLTRKDEQMNYEYRRNRMKKENDFIEGFFKEYLDKMTRERSAALDNSFGSSSRPSNRISRSSTPF